MPPTTEPRPIIIRRRKVTTGGGHVGGAWKVAYADFVTAMMAFFLLMWLLNATSEKQRKGLADYFNPTLPISRTSAGGAGMLAGDTIFTEEIKAASAPEGVPPRPTNDAPGEDPGTDPAAPDLPPGAFAAHGGPGAAEAPDDAAAPDGTDDGTERTADPDSEAEAGTGTDEAAEAERIVTDGAGLEEIGRRVEAAVEAAEHGALDRHFQIRITPEGLVIEVVDADDEPLFASASAEPAPILHLLADVLVPVLGQTANPIAVVGHTDAVPFDRAGYSNWELSADRANAARRLLESRGLPESRIARITGKAAVEPLTEDPTAPQNRRIAITLLRDRPETATARKAPR